MAINLDFYKEKNKDLYLPTLFKYLSFTEKESFKTYKVFLKNNIHYILFRTSKQYYYYKSHRPEQKLDSFDLIKEFSSIKEGNKNESLWEKALSIINNYDKENNIYNTDIDDKEHTLEVQENFNHFEEELEKKEIESNSFYMNLDKEPLFSNRFYVGSNNKILFPLFNDSNSICGLLEENKDSFKRTCFTNKGFGIWYSNIPERIEHLFVFHYPKEAMAFHKKFNPQNSIYLSLSELNYGTIGILNSIKKVIKIKKTILSLTGVNKIEGYLRDLQFISFLDKTDFNIDVKESTISILFDRKDENTFVKFFNKTKKFNNELAQEYMKFNQIMNQREVNKYSIQILKKDNMIQLIVPLEVNAIKFIVWNYYKHYLKNTIDIIKPVEKNWFSDYKANINLKQTANEETYTEYRIAL